ncbi:hypothetical protein EMIHUDRAFT_244637 [Emiliania huxleyi CCMP1516]|uniref:GRIP domain-containing protein n=2 Tax=Emiliania huxleyi TaxID=2903 RepID=A0A0D3J0E3_EMIH1|nr:hypothetical protein EMIHUDRAFT_244637 [Emiliania huxleyi CCMP1516]EOD16978.1 hypothetical protein EMIHUDRAFT_244637 [Emiliania huxleyi CCMP1516]|eukprot:XP_005769407.1 hypothetical protein EMIHUDRAFT_244637 [Emiliania huxleyi CCMP1516]
MKTEHSTAVQSKARSALSSASEHEAIVARLEAKLRQSEAEYRSARSAKRDAEAEKLRAQLASLRKMLKESHRVLSHLMKQERRGGAPQAELAVTRRDLERQQGLNAVYLKNEHIRLARVLGTVLSFSPEETAKVEARIAEYSESWWGGPASLLRDSQADGYAGLTGSLTETITALPTALSSWFWGGGTAAPAATSRYLLLNNKDATNA